MLAFAWSLRHGAIYRNLFVGIDYDQNEESDAYFNLMVEDVAHAMSQPVEEILVGQTADDFKSRLGCTSDPRYLFIKVTNGFIRWWFHQVSSGRSSRRRRRRRTATCFEAGARKCASRRSGNGS